MSYYLRIEGMKNKREYPDMASARGAGKMAFMMGASVVEILDEKGRVVYTI